MAPIFLSGDNVDNDQSLLFKNMASVACEKALSQPRTLATYKKLVSIIGRYCPSKAMGFVEVLKTLDVDNIIYPLVSDHTLWSSASDCMKNSLGLLALHCADVLHARVSSGLGTATLWSIPPASLRNVSKRSVCLKRILTRYVTQIIGSPWDKAHLSKWLSLQKLQ